MRSSISVALNSSAGVVLDDLWRPFAKKGMTDMQGAVFAKVTCVVLGVLCTGMTMAMSGLQYMIQVRLQGRQCCQKSRQNVGLTRRCRAGCISAGFGAQNLSSAMPTTDKSQDRPTEAETPAQHRRV